MLTRATRRRVQIFRYVLDLAGLSSATRADDAASTQGELNGAQEHSAVRMFGGTGSAAGARSRPNPAEPGTQRPHRSRQPEAPTDPSAPVLA